MELENINPNVFKKSDERSVSETELDESVRDPIDSREVFGKICVAYEKWNFPKFSFLLM